MSAGRRAVPVATEFRPTDPADAPAIVAFLASVLRHDPADARFEARQLDWKYWQAHPDWRGSRSYVLARGSEILAHAAVVPGHCAWRGGRVRTVHLIDWAAQPGAIGAGTTLLKRVGQLTDALLAIGGSAQTLSILPRVGFLPFGAAGGYVRTLRPVKRLTSAREPSWRLGFQFARSVLWTAAARSGYRGEWQVRRIAAEDVERADLALPAPGPRSAVLERSAAALRYLLACPSTPMALYEVRRADAAVRGYFVLASAPGQARLADCWVDSLEPADWRALVQLAVATAREQPQAVEIIARSSDPSLQATLAACGFHRRRSEPVQLLTAPEHAVHAERIHVQLLDNDAAWLHSGYPEFWA
jgi:hypothetical protein